MTWGRVGWGDMGHHKQDKESCIGSCTEVTVAFLHVSGCSGLIPECAGPVLIISYFDATSFEGYRVPAAVTSAIAVDSHTHQGCMTCMFQV